VPWSATNVWITNTRTGQSKNLTQSKGSAWDPVWSPDGKTLAFYSDLDGAAHLWIWDRLKRLSRRLRVQEGSK